MGIQFCGCGVWAKRANDPFFPIWYNAKTNEYILLFGRIAANAVTIIFCPSCGGRMPKSRRGDLFTIPIDEELAEARALLEQVDGVDAMRSLLGEPDAVFDGFKDEYGEPLRNPDGPDLIRQYTYSSRWKTLSVSIQEYEGGTLQFFFMGQPRDPAPQRSLPGDRQ